MPPRPNQKPSNPRGGLPLLIWYARCPTLTALGLVANRGALQREFLRENVSLISVREDSTPAVRQGHLDHSLPNLIREADAATALWAYGQNQRSRLLALAATYHSVSVAVPHNSAVRSLRDLAARRLSVPREAGRFSPAGVRSLRAWQGILAFAGIETKFIEFVPVVGDHPSVPFGDIVRRETEALLGDISDAGLFFGAKGLEQIRSANLREIHRFSAEDIKSDPRLAGLVEQRALTVDQQLLEGSAEAVTRVVRTLLDTRSWARAFPKEAIRQAAYEGKVDVADAQAAYGDLIVDGLDLTLDPLALGRLAELETWLKARGQLAADIDLNDWRLPDILAQAAAEKSGAAKSDGRRATADVPA